jgi:tRNA pseudouridine13 synthase
MKRTAEQVAESNARLDTKPSMEDNLVGVVKESHVEEALLLETDMGICEYVGKNSAIEGSFKQRISDFIVNEISNDNQVVQLNSFACPKSNDTPLMSNDILTEDWINQLTELSNNKSSEVFISAPDDKVARTQIHEAIRKDFPSLESSTADKDGSKVIRVIRMKHGGGKRRETWPRNTPDFCQFVLYKEKADTMEAIGLIARCLKLRVSVFSFAGTKDRRGKTSQLVTAYRVTAERLASVNSQLRNIRVGNFTYVDKPLRLGDLKGNRFHVVLRSISNFGNELHSALHCLQDRGFLNYFGTQRFGTTSVPTHHVGRELLKCNWEAAVNLIMKPRGSSWRDDRIENARRTWADTHNADAALAELGHRQCVERHLLLGLKKSAAKDFLGAFGAIPRNSRLMYVHSMQSFVWNSVVSRRVKKFGFELRPGDLVISGDDNSGDDVLDEEAGNCDDNEHEAGGETCTSENGKKLITPIVVTADTVGKYTIYDWVLPLPGHAVIYPDNETAQWYTDILAEHGLDAKCFSNSSQRDMWLPGAYRHVIVQPRELVWEVMTHADPLADLILSDWDVMEKRTLPVDESAQAASESDNKHVSLKMCFSLPSSSYANMAVREVLKVDMTPGYQTQLNTNTRS